MEIFNLLGRISIDTTQANRAITDATNQAQDSAEKQKGAFSKIGSSAGTLAKGVAGAGAVLGGQLAPEMNSRLAEIYKHNLRGNTR